MRTLVHGPYGVVLEVHGVSPGPSSGIHYTVKYVGPDGDIAGTYPLKPFVPWTATDVVAHPRSFRFPISIAGDEVIPFMPHEPPHVTECGA